MTRELRGALALLGLVLSAGPVLAQQPTQAQASAIRSACRNDYQSVCANVPTGGQAALQCLQQHASQVSAGCQQALAPLSGAQNQSPMSAPQSAPTASAPLPPLRPMAPREEARLLRADCGYDYRRFCAGVRPGGGRALECLRAHGSQLSSQCRSVLLAAAQHR
jgi:hypothetical protein